MKKKYNHKRGFTLLEILLVIALIGVLSSIVLVAINPSRQLAQSRNTERLDDITKINQALEDYFVTNRAYPVGITSIYQNICPPSGGSNCIDLSVLVPNYIPSIPTDPSGGNYKIAINPSNRQISFRAPNSEIGASIAVNAISPFPKNIRTYDNGYSEGNAVASFADGSSVITGIFSGTAIFDQGESNETSLVNAAIYNSNMFIAKYNANGSLAWAKRAGGGTGTGSYGISSLVDGSSIVTGYFSGTAVFGQGEANQTSLTSAGVDDIFIAKYNANGSLAWSKRAGGIAFDNGQSISSLVDGSSIVTGYFSGTAVFGQGEANQTSLVNISGARDMFIAKYNANGTLAWARRAGGISVDYSTVNSQSIGSFVDGSSIVTGNFYGTAVFGQGEANQTSLVSAAIYNSDMFIAKYNANGTLAWAKQVGGIGSDRGQSISSLVDGSSIVTGNFYGTAVFGQGEVNQTSLTSAGGDDIFIAKYNANGSLAWSKRAGGIAFDNGQSISSLVDGSSVITGFFGCRGEGCVGYANATVIFGQGEANQKSLVTEGEEDMFIAKYNANGTLAWVKKSGGQYSYSERGYGISTFADGSSMVTGTLWGTAIFGQGDPGATSLTNTGFWDAFIVKYDKDGILSTLIN